MNALAASVLAAGELICEFHDGWKRSLLADLMGEPPALELMIVYENISKDAAQAISSRAPGRKPVAVRATDKAVHFIQPAGASVMVTTLTKCEKSKFRLGEDSCVRWSARHAWHFDATAPFDPEKSYQRQPSGASEWKMSCSERPVSSSMAM